MKTLLLDNYDSFTYNLVQLLAEVDGTEPTVVRNDEATWAELEAEGFDNVVVSPGPGRPEHAADVGICAEAIATAAVPVLGVCLGHQALGWAFGAPIDYAPDARHGRLSTVVHDDSPLFAGIPRRFEAVRYHSLRVMEPLPGELEAIARSDDGVLMALAHRGRPLWGVQFHPESIETRHGRRLLANFRDLSERFHGRPARTAGTRRASPARVSPSGTLLDPDGVELKAARLDFLPDAESAFAELYGDSENAFWLDSSRPGDGARFSFIGAADGPSSAVVTYDVAARTVSVARGDAVERHDETIFDFLDRELRALRQLGAELPFDFDCGFAGYLGYELKADCDGHLAHESPAPDAALVFADRMVAFDHREQAAYVLALADRHGSAAAERWMARTAERLATLPELAPPAAPTGRGLEFTLDRPRERYLDDIERCRHHLHEGDSYEVCLTNRISTSVDEDPLTLYRTLRRVNPAPFAAYLRFGDRAVLSSSPERFLHVDRAGAVEAKPIKGTAARGDTPSEDARLAEALRTGEKTRAENLMITDLLRNDLGRVCAIGSVHVPRLMAIESYETVHQLVSTIRGTLRPDVGPAGCVRACFPPGSMTGAPKRRTMEILDELEGTARGVYSGALGYFGLGGGCDLSVVIRTIAVDAESATIGIGGAIVTQSDPEAELDEALLKGLAPMRAIDPGTRGVVGLDGERRALATAARGSAPRCPE